jgi:fatty acid-binding protein 3
MAGFEGKWNVDSTEHFDDYMKALGVGMVMRKMGASVKPIVTISRNADTWTIKSESSLKTTSFDFQFGKEFDETTADGRNVKSTITEDSPQKWTHVQKGDPPSTLVRELLDGNTLKLTMTAKGVTATRIYKRSS